ncbi:AsmA family protein [Xylophilus rhododendri]|uniref:AsmA family protein n=1 Tax=Xylophilus rhododendri TaxID=2697032 RepID=A0A857J9L1_9BURK|nr:AsmA family protein [Xylophilus rhododendri]QHI99428.1 AsmA family protein [Xylophilus rhododendri]
MTLATPASSSADAQGARRRWPARLAIGLVVLLLALVLLIVFFPWDWLRGPINRYVSDKTGRHFAITRHLDVKLGRTATVIADGIEFANPGWAQDPYLVKAEKAEIGIRLWPLLSGKVVLPAVTLQQPEIGLQMEPDGRRTWALGKDSSDSGTTPDIGHLLVDRGQLHFLAADKGADIRVNFGIDQQIDKDVPGALPFSFDAKGSWKKQAFAASGRTGSLLQLSPGAQTAPFPVELKASAGQTRLAAKGSIGNLSTLEGVDAQAQMQGQNLADLYQLIGVVLPDTPPYAVKGHLTKQGAAWDVAGLQGKLGSSDLSGHLRYDAGGAKALLSGEVQSKLLDFNDLAPVIGLAPTPTKGSRTTEAGTVPPVTAAAAQKGKRSGGKVLPTAKLDLEKLNAMNADVSYSAQKIEHIEQLPLDSGKVHVKLTDGLLVLDPLDLGVAGGHIAGHIRVDSKQSPPAVSTRLEARALQINRLFPSIDSSKNSFGNVSLRVDLQARGDSVATLLAHANGETGLLVGSGRFSNLLLEFVGLDGAEVIKFFLRGDKEVRMRCGGAAFDVKNGLMTSKGIVFDTTDTVVNGDGRINLADESMYITLRPQPKDKSFLSLRSPLIIQGTFGDPSAFPDKGALAGRAAAAVALGLINPFLALAATIETGPGEDADCQRLLTRTDAPKPVNR